MTAPISTLFSPARPYGAPPRFRNLAAAILLALAPGAALAEVTLLAFGDSLTQGYGLPEEQGFVPQLEDWLHAQGAQDVSVINGGVSGDTTAGGLARIDWALSEDVDGVIVALGGNDLLRGLDPGEARDNLDGILAAIAERGLPVLLAGLPAPSNFGPDYQRAFERLYPELAETHGAILYPSFLGALGRSLEEARALMQADGIHPSAEGIEAIVADIGPVVLDLVERAREQPQASRL
jgi:acyl-CoA thioesterase I